MAANYTIKAKPCISSIPKELHIIKTKFGISSLRKEIQPRGLMIYSSKRICSFRRMISTLKRDDIPLLSQWIKKSKSLDLDFLVHPQGLDSRANCRVACNSAVIPRLCIRLAVYCHVSNRTLIRLRSPRNLSRRF